jgi:hypothetical protein
MVLVRIEQKGKKGMVHATSQQHAIVRELYTSNKKKGWRYVRRHQRNRLQSSPAAWDARGRGGRGPGCHSEQCNCCRALQSGRMSGHLVAPNLSCIFLAQHYTICMANERRKKKFQCTFTARLKFKDHFASVDIAKK